MTPEEIAASEDVSELYTHFQAARAFGDDQRVRLLQARMRELSGANAATKPDDGRRVAADDAAIEKIHRDATFRGGHFA